MQLLRTSTRIACPFRLCASRFNASDPRNYEKWVRPWIFGWKGSEVRLRPPSKAEKGSPVDGWGGVGVSTQRLGRYGWQL
jgi:hypothetical protein